MPTDREPALEAGAHSGDEAPLPSETFHRLVRLFLVLAYGTDRELHPLERRAIAALVCRWQPRCSAREAEGVVDAAFAAVRGAAAESPEALAEALAPVLPPALRRRALADLGIVAKADGWLSLREASLIARVRQLWDQQAAAPAAAPQPGSSRSR